MANMEKENTYKNLPPKEKNQAVMKEMMPFLFYAAIPLILTIILAKVFGPPSY